MNTPSAESTWSAAVPHKNIVELPCLAHEQALRPGDQLPREGTLWLIAATIIFVTGFFKGINLLIFLAYLLFGLWFINWRRAWRDVKRLRGRRRPTGPIVAGASARFQLELAVVGRAAVRGASIEEWAAAGKKRWMLLRQSASGPVRIEYDRLFERRGRNATGPLLAHSRYPFGLIGGAVVLEPALDVLVLPRTGRLNVELLRRWLANVTRGDGRVRRRQAYLNIHVADLHGLRDFRPGDSPRWIHWRSSARRDQILVREFEDSGAPDLIVVVEPFLPDHPSDEDREKLESLVSLAATVCSHWCHDPQSRLILIVLGSTVTVHTGHGGEYAQRLLEGFAVLEGSSASPADSWIEQAPMLGSSLPILVLSSRAGSRLAAQLEAAVARPVSSVAIDEAIAWYEPPATSTAKAKAGSV